MESRLKLGELLVRAGLVEQSALDSVLAVQSAEGRRLGHLLVARGLLTETQVTQILSQQLSIPWVSLQHVAFSTALLSLVPGDLAARFTLIPIFVRRLRGRGEVLYVAMDDPVDDEALAEVASAARISVKPMIASPSDIRAAIQANYGIASEHADEAPESAPPSSLVPSLFLESAPPSSLELEAISVRHLGLPVPSLFLTLPDGSERKLPAAPGSADSERWRRAIGPNLAANQDVDWESFSANLLAWMEDSQLITAWQLQVEAKRPTG